MSSKSQRRRQRKSRQNKCKNQVISNVNYMNKFKIIEECKLNDIVLSGYIREINQTDVPLEVETLCRVYYKDEDMLIKELDEITPTICNIVYEKEPSYYEKTYESYQQRKEQNKLQIVQCTLKFNDIFNRLLSYQKIQICRRIIRQMKLPIHNLRVWAIDDDDILREQLYFVEYILYKRYNTLSKLDLSQINITDRHILYLCNAIEHIMVYRKQKKVENAKRKNGHKEQSISVQKHSKQQPKKKAHIQKQLGNKNTVPKRKETLKYSTNRKVQKEIEKHLKRMKERENIVNVDKIQVKMKLEEMNLSLNNITDKYLDLLLRTIKRYIPGLKRLILSSNNITNKSLVTIMKYGIKGLLIDLSVCKGVTLKGLNKYARTDYYDEVPQQYVYCENMVYFVNTKEEKYEDKDGFKGGKRVRGKGKKFRGNRKRTIFNGRVVTDGYNSMEDWWI